MTYRLMFLFAGAAAVLAAVNVVRDLLWPVPKWGWRR
jgi:hypothetical protein